MDDHKSTATVETLTAEVQVLMVGNRQVTLSVARQVDAFDVEDDEAFDFTPFGRVRTGAKGDALAWCSARDRGAEREVINGRVRYRRWIERAWDYEWIGRRGSTGTLILIHAMEDNLRLAHEDVSRMVEDWKTLPLIVLAGLR